MTGTVCPSDHFHHGIKVQGRVCDPSQKDLQNLPIRTARIRSRLTCQPRVVRTHRFTAAVQLRHLCVFRRQFRHGRHPSLFAGRRQWDCGIPCQGRARLISLPFATKDAKECDSNYAEHYGYCDTDGYCDDCTSAQAGRMRCSYSGSTTGLCWRCICCSHRSHRSTGSRCHCRRGGRNDHRCCCQYR